MGDLEKAKMAGWLGRWVAPDQKEGPRGLGLGLVLEKILVFLMVLDWIGLDWVCEKEKSRLRSVGVKPWARVLGGA